MRRSASLFDCVFSTFLYICHPSEAGRRLDQRSLIKQWGQGEKEVSNLPRTDRACFPRPKHNSKGEG